MTEFLSEQTVIKIGGSIAGEQNTLKNAAFLDAGMHIPLVIVHGGGPEINKALEESGIKPQKVNGLRVTDNRTLDVVVSVLNRINSQMVNRLQELGVNAIGYGSDSNLLWAECKKPELGFVGEVCSVDIHSLRSRLREGFVPVIAPIAVTKDQINQQLNINGDTAAGAIAAALRANLVLATDVKGVQGADGKVLASIDRKRYEELCGTEIINGGMIPKIEAGLVVVKAGGRAVICSGEDLLYAFVEKPRGTEIMEKERKYKGVVEKANLADTESIHRLINHYADKGEMLPRALSQIYEHISGYFVCRNETREVLGCAALQPVLGNTGEIKSVAVWEEDQNKGIGKDLVKACVNEARRLGLPSVFLLTYRPEVFGRMGFEQVNKDTLSEKVWRECYECPKYSPAMDCGEVAMVRKID